MHKNIYSTATMTPPIVTIYVTSLTSAPAVRRHHDLLRSSLNAMDIKYEEYDLVMDEEAKRRWQRAKPAGKVIGLPGYLVGGEWIGTMEDFEEAVETQSLESFLKQDLNIPDEAPTIPDPSAPSASKQKSMQEVELEKIMGEMTNEDLDKLMNDLGVSNDVGKVGLINQSSSGIDIKSWGGEGGVSKGLAPTNGEDVISKFLHQDEKKDENKDTNEGAGGYDNIKKAKDEITDVLEDEKKLVSELKKEYELDAREEKDIALAEKKEVGKLD
ncbi:hypothetical protein C365_01528 [Cryptococcus neoformans Bt85]|nr:hypothetical protein C365_01528 [Cryptococcus neoformans var. grubii Bt85]OXM80964.1 hypothetical protein C364_01335 [Cryptococcus neoformans var. grubii Bt63]